MSSGSRFIVPAIAALGVSVVSAGFLAARRIHSGPSAESASVSSLAQQQTAAEPTPAALPSPVATPMPSPVAPPDVEPAAPAPSAPALRSETVVTKASATKPTARTETKTRTPARDVAAARPATNVDPPRRVPTPVVEPAPAAPAQPAVKETTRATTPTVDAVPAPPPATPVESAPVETPRPRYEEHRVRADSVLGIQIDQSLSSATAKLEDRVSASVSRDLIVDGRTVLPRGTRLEGTVSLVQPGSKFKGRARLGIRFHTIVLGDGMRVPIQTETLYRDGESATGATAKKVGGGAAHDRAGSIDPLSARRSASAFNGLREAQRITMMPGERNDQYRRNFERDTGLVATARVSVRKTEASVPIGSARSVQTILT
jgi:hypothetical protein